MIGTKQLIIYRNFKYQSLFDGMAKLLNLDEGEQAVSNPCSFANQLIELAADYGFEGNLWQCSLPG